jgi:hypothetical protein
MMSHRSDGGDNDMLFLYHQDVSWPRRSVVNPRRFDSLHQRRFDLPLASRTPILVRGDAGWLAVGMVKNPPRSVRTCLSDLGSDGRFFDDGEVIQLLRVAIEQDGNQMAFAKRHSINRTFLNEVVNGKRPASGSILKALGLHKVYAFDQNK